MSDKRRAGKMAQYVEGLATKPENQSSIPRLHTVEGTDYPILFSEPHICALQHTHVYKHTCTHTHKTNIMNVLKSD